MDIEKISLEKIKAFIIKELELNNTIREQNFINFSSLLIDKIISQDPIYFFLLKELTELIGNLAGSFIDFYDNTELIFSDDDIKLLAYLYFDYVTSWKNYKTRQQFKSPINQLNRDIAVLYEASKVIARLKNLDRITSRPLDPIEQKQESKKAEFYDKLDKSILALMCDLQLAKESQRLKTDEYLREQMTINANPYKKENKPTNELIKGVLKHITKKKGSKAHFYITELMKDLTDTMQDLTTLLIHYKRPNKEKN